MTFIQKYLPAFLLVLSVFSLNAQDRQIQQVLDQEARRFAAMTQADVAALAPMLSEDLVYVHSNAMKENKQEHLKAISTKKLIYQKMTREAAQVRFYGKTALVNGKVNVQGLLIDKAFDIQLLYLAAYRKKKGAWQLVHWQSTKQG